MKILFYKRFVLSEYLCNIHVIFSNITKQDND